MPPHGDLVARPPRSSRRVHGKRGKRPLLPSTKEIAGPEPSPFLRLVRGDQAGHRPGAGGVPETAAEVHLDAAVWVLPEHKTKKKIGKPRVVYLTPAMVELTRKLAKRHPEGPLFRNSRGKP